VRWLLEDTGNPAVLTPERLDDDHRLIGRTADEFVDNEVLPLLDRLEQKDWSLARSLIRRSGELGLLGTDVPEHLGGVGLDRAAALVVGESAGRCASFATTFGAQTGLAVTPLLCFGSENQKRQYVPRLVSGELIGAYALSESGSGSDALSAKTRAERKADGGYVLNGEKMWITNGGFADVFIVFARLVDGAETGQFTAFIVERAFGGVSSGREEHKMGLHGSSTTPLTLQDVSVPAGNVLGQPGKGHKVAFNVLNYGRFKLAAMCSGGARRVIGQAAAYATERRQFGRPIASFGAIRHKLAEMVIREYAAEAMLYRVAGLLDDALKGAHEGPTVVAALEELAIEASIVKVASSEMLDFVVDENVQIHGGNGFVRDYPAERQYRDARVNRIFEGTNEINRLLIPGMLARRAAKGELPVLEVARILRDELMTATATEPGAAAPLDGARRAVAAMKSAALMVLASALEVHGEGLSDEQEVLSRAADIIIDVFASESVVFRAIAAGSALHEASACVFVNDAAARVSVIARDALAAMRQGEDLRVALGALERLMKTVPINTVDLRRRLADAIVRRRMYPF